jgi:hypothetical protein
MRSNSHESLSAKPRFDFAHASGSWTCALRNTGFPTGQTRRLESRRYGGAVHGKEGEKRS